VFNISNKKSILSIDGVGLNSNRLPSNMYIKYNEHRKIAQDIWNIPKNSINPVSNTYKKIISNINNNITSFLWIISDNKNTYLNNLKNENLFIVNSSSLMHDGLKNSNLILPSSNDEEKETIYGDYQRKVRYKKQTKLPYEQSMSLLWQVIELSKRFYIKDIYKRVKVDNQQALQNTIKDFLKLGYKKEDSLYKILFYNSKTKLFPRNMSELNTESNGDKRKIIGSDGGIFKGYRYLMQEYLFEEYRQFTINNSHDLKHYLNYKNSKQAILWPYVNNKEIVYRFNPIDDIYALKSAKSHMNYSFYGRMGKKSLKFGNLEEVTSEEKKSLKYRAKIFTTTK